MYRILLESYKSLTTFDARCSSIMDAPTIQPKFLPKRNELGLVAVGFSGGQVGSAVTMDIGFTHANNGYSANQASMRLPWL